MKKVAKFGIIAVLLVGLVASSFAFGRGNEAAREALEAGDYAAWKNAMIAELTEERFNQMRERYNQMAEKRVAMQEKRAEIEAAMEQGYDAWKEAVADSPREAKLTEVITKENFDTFVEMHEAMQNGDYETAKALAEELEVEGLGRGFFGRGGCLGGFRPRMDFE